MRLPADVELRVTARPPRLRLRRETLAELTTDDLHRVAGADAATVAGVCATIAVACPSMRLCTTFPSCGCPLTEFC